MANRVARRGYSRVTWDALTVEELQSQVSKILTNLANPARMERATIRDAAAAVGILIDRLRLLRGESTVNVAIATRDQGLERIAQLAERLESALATRTPPDAHTMLSIDPIADSRAIPARCESIDAEYDESVPDKQQDGQLGALPVPVPVTPVAARRGRGRPRTVRPAPADSESSNNPLALRSNSAE